MLVAGDDAQIIIFDEFNILDLHAQRKHDCLKI